ncbi:hypothetical protein, partial [Exiguobacterium indicum]|uniref:hypothetical protein n=1 Tax=Exiguobacterium indicum TaxID=296995 RepID=UPI002B258E59
YKYINMDLTKKHYEYFKKQIKYYIELYNITDITCRFEMVETHDKFLNAFVDNDVSNGLATYYFILKGYLSDKDNIYD